MGRMKTNEKSAEIIQASADVILQYIYMVSMYQMDNGKDSSLCGILRGLGAWLHKPRGSLCYQLVFVASEDLAPLSRG